jgi:hypothetical protein
MREIVDKISEKAVSLMIEYILKLVKGSEKHDLWKRAVKKACEATEGVNDSFADYMIKSLAIQRHFVWLISNKSLDDLYRSFILTIAIERCKYNDEKNLQYHWEWQSWIIGLS